MKRASLTPRERAEMVLAQDGKCACCGRDLGVRFVAEHTLPVKLGNASKPDCLLREDCAAEKTRADVRQIAKAKRQAGETGQQARRARRGCPLIRSAGFRGHRRMNGEIVWRGK